MYLCVSSTVILKLNSTSNCGVPNTHTPNYELRNNFARLIFTRVLLISNPFLIRDVIWMVENDHTGQKLETRINATE